MSKIQPQFTQSIKHKSDLTNKLVIGENERELRCREMEEYKHLKCLLFPDDIFYEYFTLLITILLIFTAIVTPYRIALVEKDSLDWFIIDLTIDCIFFLDVIFNCFLAYYDKEQILITNRQKIFMQYLKGWMLLDLLACMPFQLLTEATIDYSNLIRVAKLPRLYRIIKMAKLMRMLKVVKSRNHLMRYMSNLLKFNMGVERILWLIIVFIIMIHLVACTWAFIGKFYEIDDSENWIQQSGYMDSNNTDLYIISVYWAVTTLTTVGYGDITAYNSTEEWVSCLVMVLGILIYSYMIGSFTNIITQLDSRNAKLKKKLDILTQLAREYNFDKAFTKKLSTAIEYKNNVDRYEVDQLLNDFPSNLKAQLLNVIYSKMIKGNAFLQSQPDYFTAAIVQDLKPAKFEKNEIIYHEGDYADHMYFIVKGKATFEVLLNKRNLIQYNDVGEGYYFGELDVLFSGNMTRFHTVRSLTRTKMLILSYQKLKEIMEKFKDESVTILTTSKERLDRIESKKQEAIDEFYKSGGVRRYESAPKISQQGREDFIRGVSRISEESDDQSRSSSNSEDEDEETKQSFGNIKSSRLSVPSNTLQRGVSWLKRVENQGGSTMVKEFVNRKLQNSDERIGQMRDQLKSLESTTSDLKNMMSTFCKRFQLATPIKKYNSVTTPRTDIDLPSATSFLGGLLEKVHEVAGEDNVTQYQQIKFPLINMSIKKKSKKSFYNNELPDIRSPQSQIQLDRIINKILLVDRTSLLRKGFIQEDEQQIIVNIIQEDIVISYPLQAYIDYSEEHGFFCVIQRESPESLPRKKIKLSKGAINGELQWPQDVQEDDQD